MRLQGTPEDRKNRALMLAPPKFMKFAALSCVFAASLLLTACPNGQPVNGQLTINITNGGGSYNPASATVQAGTVVMWVNQDSQPHTATSPGAFDSGVIAPSGGQWTWVASIPGTHPYQDMIGGKISGTLTVTQITPVGQ